METAIIYSSRRGATEEVARQLKEKLNGEAQLFNVKEEPKVDLSGFRNVIIGGPIYAGKLKDDIHQFVENNLLELLERKVALFICCMHEEKADEQLNGAFPELLKKQAVACHHVGGQFNFKRMNFIERLMVKKITGLSEDVSTLSDEKIDAIAQAIKY